MSGRRNLRFLMTHEISGFKDKPLNFKITLRRFTVNILCPGVCIPVLSAWTRILKSALAIWFAGHEDGCCVQLTYLLLLTLFLLCPGFIPVAMIKFPDREQSRGDRIYASVQFPMTAHHGREVKGVIPRTAETRDVHTCLVLGALTLLWYSPGHKPGNSDTQFQHGASHIC